MRWLLIMCLAACGGAASTPRDGGSIDGALGDAALGDAAQADAADASTQCGLEAAPSATVSGTTPLGSFDGRFAWVRYTSDEGACNGFPTLFIQSSSPITGMFGQWQGSGLSFTVLRDSSFSLLGPRDVEVVYRVGGQQVSATGHVELTRADPHTDPEPRVEGTVSVTAPGWSVSGSFSAAHCALLDVHCI
jgi:hypothetical protein